jgi:3-oxoacyl-(acyl-carrier-protein) synthase
VQALGDARLPEPRFVRLAEAAAEDWAGARLLHICDEALADAAPALPEASHARVALFCATTLGGMSVLEATHRQTWGSAQTGPGLPVAPGIAPSQGGYSGPASFASSSLGGLSAGAWTMNTACSSAVNALGLAHLWLLQDRIDVALVAGVDVISAFVYSGFCGLGAVDAEPSRPFMQGRAGLNLGEAAVAFVLVRSADSASATAMPEVLGAGTSCDGFHVTRPHPEGAGLVRAMRMALSQGELGASAIDFINAHATGTQQNDAMEAKAFLSVFGNTEPMPPIFCTKPVFGHTLGAAGAVDVLAVTEALCHGELPAVHTAGVPDPALAVHPVTSARALPSEAVCLATSSGFGGSNAAVLLRGGRAR